MIICSNCGATNNEENGRICRKCGALLPTSRRTPRLKMAPSKKEKKEAKPQKRIPDKKKVSIRSSSISFNFSGFGISCRSK